MANITNKNPMVIDTVGSVMTTPFEIGSINIIASADTWEVVLKDASGGNEIFRAVSAITNDRGGLKGPYVIGPTKVSGIYADTLTDITSVQIYGHSNA